MPMHGYQSTKKEVANNPNGYLQARFSCSGFDNFFMQRLRRDRECETAGHAVLRINGGNGVRITQNGYLYVYVSNTNEQHPVYFDNLNITHHRGALLEETSYYPFGLTMSGISSKALVFGNRHNKKGFNGNEIQNKEFADGSGLEVYDFNARTYDQQIGRFIQIDPESEEADQEGWSPYHFGYNNPILYSDPDGKIPIPLIAIGLKFVIGAAIEYGSQVYDNYKSGKTGGDAWKPTSYEKIGLNGITSTIDPSGGVGKKIAITAATNVVESVGGQILDGKGVTLSKTVTDVAVMTVAGNAKTGGSKTVASLEKKADKLERVAKNSPSARNKVQAKEARDAAVSANVKNQGAETATTESTESALGKKVDNVNFTSVNGVGSFNPNAPRVDNVYVAKRPILFPRVQ
jgi:RHS repeat-associated protein